MNNQTPLQKKALEQLRSVSKQKAISTTPLFGLDLKRAKCFIDLKYPYYTSAVEQALLEELRHFPENDEATQLLNEIRQIERFDKDVQTFNDPEFIEIKAQIKDYTMLPDSRLFALWNAAKNILKSNINPIFVECGVAAGGSSAMLAYLLKQSGGNGQILAFDSFAGMPQESNADTCNGIAAADLGWGQGTCHAKTDSLVEIANKLGASDFVSPISGYFEHTLPDYSLIEIQLLHVDCDWFESIKTVLDFLYPKVVTNGYIQIDDYGYWDGVEKAVEEYKKENSLKFRVTTIDGFSVWIQK